MGKKKKYCWNCLSSHLPPTGNKCANVAAEFSLDHAGWEDVPDPTISDYCWGEPQKRTCDTEKGLVNPTPEVKDFSTTGQTDLNNQSGWPPLTPKNSAANSSLKDPGNKRFQSAQGARSISSLPASGNFGDYIPKLSMDNGQDIRFQVTELQNEMSRLALDSRSSQDKLARIEGLLQDSLSNRQHGQPRHPNRNRQLSPPPSRTRGRPRNIDNGRKKETRQGLNHSPSSTSPYGSSRSSSYSNSPRRGSRTQKSSSDKERDTRDRRMYKIKRFLPHDERSKPLSTDRLWFCHGAFMLEQYLCGNDIEGMLRHNVFISEKTSSRAYMASGICKYDEAVRDRAKYEGLNSYTGGDMDLSVRFLSTEYARPRMGPGGSINSGKQSQNRKNTTSSSKDSKKLLCWNFNGVGCNFDTCKYPHLCSKCFSASHSQHTCRSVPYQYANPNVLPPTSAQA